MIIQFEQRLERSKMIWAVQEGEGERGQTRGDGPKSGRDIWAAFPKAIDGSLIHRVRYK